MELVINFLLILGTLCAATFSYVLARRVRKLGDLDQGLGKAISALSSQVDDMSEALLLAQKQASSSTREIETLTARAEKAATRLELLLAGLHENRKPQKEDPARARKRKIAELRKQKQMEEAARPRRKVANGSEVSSPNEPTRQELLDSITNIIGNLQR